MVAKLPRPFASRLMAWLSVAVLALAPAHTYAADQGTPGAGLAGDPVMCIIDTSALSATYTNLTMQMLRCDVNGKLITNATGGGGGGGAATIANGADVAQGSTTDAASCASPRTVSGCLAQIDADAKAPIPGGTNAIGGVTGVELTDTTGTFTNGTQTTSVTSASLDGYGSALISINGTYGTATAVFEMSDDGGTTWYGIQAVRSDGTAVDVGYTALTNTNRAWFLSTAGIDQVRVRSTAVASGTINVRISASSVANPNANPATTAAVQSATIANAAPGTPNTTTVLSIQGETGMTPVAIKPQGSAAAADGIAPVVGGSAVSSLVLKAGPGNLYSAYAECSAACWLMIFNAVAAPSNGATTAGIASGNLQDCVAIAAGGNGTVNYRGAPPEVFSVGITAAISSTTCATLTLATTGFIHGDIQ